MSALFEVRDKVVIVTGGLGRLGSEFAASLTGHGARVAVFETPERCRAAETASKATASPRCFPIDITDRKALERGLEEVRSAWGEPHALVNCAAIDAPPDADAAMNGPFESVPAEAWERVFAVNARGTFLCCQVIGAALARAGRGSIVTISSIYGVVSPDQRLYEFRRAEGEPFFKPAAYGASKAAAHNLTRYLATYWAGRGVRANTLTLGGVQGGQDPRFVEAYCRRVPLGRMARPADYLGPLHFLLSDASSYMTGAELVIDGGWTAW